MRYPSLGLLALLVAAPSAHAVKLVTVDNSLQQTVVSDPKDPVVQTPPPGGTGNGNQGGDSRTPTTIGSNPAPQTTPVTQPTTVGQQQPTTAPTGLDGAPGKPNTDSPQLAQQKQQVWQLLDSGNKDAAQQAIKEALKQNPDDADLKVMAQLSQTHDMNVDSKALAGKMAGLGGARDAGGAAQAGKPILASALGFLAAPNPALRAAQVPLGLHGTLSRATMLKMQMRDYGGAERDLSETIAAEPTNWMAFRLRAFTRRFMKKVPEAESDADRALQLNPKDGPSHNVKALLRLDSRDPQGAIAEATAALRLNGHDGDALATRAQALEALGRRDEALADLKLAADLDPQFGALYRQALYDTPGQKVAQTRALYAAAAGLSLLLFGLSLFAAKRSKTTVKKVAMRAADQTPSGVSGFRILRRLGMGGMGVVYEAYDETLHRKVALKRMRDEIAADPRERRRFMREARLVAGLRHPGIVEIFSVMEQDQALYLVFEYLPGETLDALVEKRGGKLSPSETLPLARQIAEALDYAHAQGVVHQDLKPANILVTAAGAKVMDFGIARRVQETLSTMSRSESVGTPAYMAPEQEQGIVTPKADLFALGVVLYEALAGKAPFGRGGGAFSKVDGHFPALSRVSGLPESVDAVINSALSSNPEKRPASACALVAALESALSQARA